MPKDYKDAPSPRAESRLNHPLLLGVIIGLLLGIVISLAVALWLNRLSNPFVDKGKTMEPLPKIAPAQPPPPPDAAKAAEQAAKGKAPEKATKPGERPRFEFYQILPGEKEAPDRAPGAPKPSVQPPAPSAATAKPGSSPSSPKPHSGEVYWLQAGAFAEEKEADNLKAKIALVGLEATIRETAIPDKGRLFRVRLGPYQSLDDANRIKAALSQNGVSTAIIRSTDDAKKQ
ncbi:MAG TPA: SPOR domain-containing protein [Usitatibacter sp.]|nr:SPOR domain-containing protein [Usitatibacter sp.]